MSAARVKSGREGFAARLVRRARRRPRFNFAAVLFFVLVTGLVSASVQPARAILIAFDISALAFLAMLVQMFAGAGKAQIVRRSREEDQGRWSVLFVGVSLSIVVVVALGLELHAADHGGVPQIALAAGTLILSWLFMNAMFAVHYAHAYYGDDLRSSKCGGLEFPGKDDPDYWDFAYFAIVVGMTFQVSDVQITDRGLRRAVLLQSVIAFFFNVIIIAISVNVVAGKA
ncbi:MAG: DUF1345 domain-containing protein [Dokdonella sp.]